MSKKSYQTFALKSTINGSILVNAKTSEKGQKYYCPGCNEEFILAKGTKRIHHFRHKTDICSLESYLHKTGKKILYQLIKEEKIKVISFIDNIYINKIKITEIYYGDSAEDYKELYYDHMENLGKNIFLEKEFIIEDEPSIEKALKSHIEDNKYIENSYKNIIENKFFFFVYLNSFYFDSENIPLIENEKYLIDFFHIIRKKGSKKTIKFYTQFYNDLGIEVDNELDISKKYNKKHKYYWIYDRKKINNLPNLIRFYLNLILADKKLHIKSIQWFDNYLSNAPFEVKENMVSIFLKMEAEIINIKSGEKDIDVFNYEQKFKLYLDSKKYKGYLADVLIERGEDNPFFLEIAVTHELEENKINLGVPILEFKLKDNEDLENLFNLNLGKLNCNFYVEGNKKDKLKINYILMPNLNSKQTF